MRDKTRHDFNNGYVDRQGPGNNDINYFLSGITEAKSFAEGEHSASITHFGNISNYVRALDACKDFPALKSLTVLCQNNPPFQSIDNAVSTLIEVLQSNPQLQKLEFQHLELELNAEMVRLFEIIRDHPGLQMIDLVGALFANAETQAACLSALAEKKNLITLGCNFTWHGDAGFSQLVRMNNSIQSLRHVPCKYVTQFVDDLTANPDSHLKCVSIASHREYGYIAGVALLRLIQKLKDQNKDGFTLSNDYSCRVRFDSMEQANQLLELACFNLMCMVSLEIQSIGNVNRYTFNGNNDAYVKSYQDKLDAVRDRNLGILTAYFDQNHEGNKENDFLLAELVYLHHQTKYEETFGERPKNVYAVSLKARTYFQLFTQNPEKLRSVEDLNEANERILNHRDRYKL